MPLTTSRVRAGSSARRAAQVPLTARLSASVPPEVKTTSDGPGAEDRGDPLARLLDDARAARPVVCSEDALPTIEDCSVSASTAAGSIGVVAAWSR